MSTKVILIPAFEPGPALIATTGTLVAAGYDVTVVDDGSGPAYQAVFEKLNVTVHLVRHVQNQGKGAALKTGYRSIQSRYQDYVVITADADGQHHVEDIKKLAQAYDKYPGSLLLGARTFEQQHVPLRSRFGNVLTRKLFSAITKQPLQDTQTGLRAFDQTQTDFMLSVRGEHFEYEMNVLLESSAAGISIIEVPIKTIYEAGNQSSHFNPIIDSWSIYKEIILFASSSLLAFVIDYLLFAGLLFATSYMGIAGGVIISNVFARIVSASCNFAINKRLVFRRDKNNASFVRYAVLAGGILLGNTIVLSLLTNVLHVDAYLAKLITELTFFVASYIIQKNVVFTKKRVTYV